MAASLIPGVGLWGGAAIDALLTTVNSLITTGMQNGWDMTWDDIGNALFNGAVSGGFSLILGHQNISMTKTKAFTRASSLSSAVSKKIRNGTYYLNKSVSAGKQAVRAARKAAMRSIVPAFTTNEAYFAYGISLAQSILSNLLS